MFSPHTGHLLPCLLAIKSFLLLAAKMILPYSVALFSQYLIRLGSYAEFLPATLTCLTIWTEEALNKASAFSFPLRSLVIVRKSHLL
jgi:hypothetical protein